MNVPAVEEVPANGTRKRTVLNALLGIWTPLLTQRRRFHSEKWSGCKMARIGKGPQIGLLVRFPARRYRLLPGRAPIPSQL